MVPRPAAGRFAGETSWSELLSAVGGSTARLRPSIPDPDRTGAGLAALVLADRLLAAVPESTTVLTNLLRAARENLAPTPQAQFDAFRPGPPGRLPLVLAPEQAVYSYNRADPAIPATALYPREGTLALDYPVTLTTADARRRAAGRLLARRLAAGVSGEVRRLGFRSADGTASEEFGPAAGVVRTPPGRLAPPAPADVDRVLQTWSRLSLGVRMLVLFDVSISMNIEVAPGTSRLEATARGAQQGLTLLPDDSELGIWTFSTELQDGQDWREVIPVGPLGERLGSSTRRQLILSGLSELQVEQGGTGLHDSVLAAFRAMSATYRPDMVNTVLLFTDGRNADNRGLGLEETLAALRREYDPARPVQIMTVGYGPDVDVRELGRLVEVTGGLVQVAADPAETRRMLLIALSRRACAPRC